MSRLHGAKRTATNERKAQSTEAAAQRLRLRSRLSSRLSRSAAARSLRRAGAHRKQQQRCFAALALPHSHSLQRCRSDLLTCRGRSARGCATARRLACAPHHSTCEQHEQRTLRRTHSFALLLRT